MLTKISKNKKRGFSHDRIRKKLQGTAERGAFDRAELDRLLDLAVAGCAVLANRQQEALGA